MKKILVLLIITFILGKVTFGQKPATIVSACDETGQTSFFFHPITLYSIFNINHLGLFYSKRSTNAFLGGLYYNIKNEDKFIKIFEQGKLSFNSSFDLVVGVKELFKNQKKLDAWIFTKIGGNFGKYKVLPDINKDIETVYFFYPNFSLNYNMLINGNTFLGVSLSNFYKNNYSDLPTVKRQIFYRNDDSVVVFKEDEVKFGNFQSFNNYQIRTDFYKSFKDFALYFYFRTDYLNESKVFKYGTGLGIFKINRNNILSFSYGMKFGFSDLNNPKNFYLSLLIQKPLKN